MKILVLSDSHAALSFMRRCIDAVKPHTVIHLGDYFDDGTAMAEEYPAISFYQVPGNCDKYRDTGFAPETRIEKICGVKLYLSHGHLQRVKQSLGGIIAEGRKFGTQAVLFGHTHVACCQQQDDGLWVLNPGSCGYFGGSAAIMEVDQGKILSCRIIRQTELEEMI